MTLRLLRHSSARTYEFIGFAFVFTIALSNFACSDNVEDAASVGGTGAVTPLAGRGGASNPREGGVGAVSGSSSGETGGTDWGGNGSVNGSGGSDTNGSGATNGGSTSGGATGAAGEENGGVGGDLGTGGTLSAGAGGDAGGPGSDSLCTLADGSPIPYDFSRGLCGEYAFELSLDCGLGGYLEPLVAIDPVNLTGVDQFVGELTAWFRGSILGCQDPDAEVQLKTFSLLPRSLISQISRGDFRAAVELFMKILDRHDGLADGFDAEKKAEIEARLNAFARTTIKRTTRALTKPSSAPECTTNEGGSGGQ